MTLKTTGSNFRGSPSVIRVIQIQFDFDYSIGLFRPTSTESGAFLAAGFMRVIDLDEMIRRLRAGGPRRLTWVIGAGFSASAGIPLAAGICKRLLTFHYLQKKPNVSPYAGKIIKGWTEADIGPFLKWADENVPEFDRIASDARNWANGEDDLKGYLDDEQRLYARLFEQVTPGPESTQAFLSEIIRRSPGPNLAHRLLAHVLQNFPSWGHTVFTTNFDDLMIQSLMLAGHTGRIYGDITSQDQPENDPRVPQVAHLHGRHVGYNMRNSPDEILAPNPALEGAFRKHVGESTVIVVGYGGWNDIVMKVLNEARSGAGAIRGNLYWVAHDPKPESLPSTVQGLLTDCTKAYLVTAESRAPLPADLFMLRLMRVWDLDPKEVIEEIRSRQFDAFKSVSDQLERYPDYGPGEADRLLDDANLAFGLYKYDSARTSATMAADASRSASQRANLARAFRLLGDIDQREDRLENSRHHYEEALPIFREIRGRLGEANTLRSLGNLEVREDKLEPAREHYEQALPIYREIRGRLGEANTLKSLGNLEVREDTLEPARKHYEQALPIFREIRGRLGEANTLMSLGDLELREDKLEAARQHYKEAREIYGMIGERNGESIVGKKLRDLDK